ncbi:hypothetical protein B0H63DRAFT_446043 [Podospora didyma]|uniref:Mitochondrial intermembrane space import and assembly protein 40 n=1 Tax=Podospora didyma TaxID=330526 RepID=A0AAE0NYA0_9PEZI|nr:hypothetical protein B0H63DRAFT_446043 [Podospora didyma]
MYRTTVRSAPSALRAIRPTTATTLTSGSRRLLSTAPAPKKGTWKGAGVRWGLAIAAVYWYNTSPIFADELPPQAGPAPPPFSDSDLPTITAVIEEKRRNAAAAAAVAPPPPPPQHDGLVGAEDESSAPAPGSPEALEEEAGQQGAFNPETGEINWDCPCLGGMAHGPCGENFKEAFSCFVFSKEEPKGMDCIDKFQGMQDCFRQYPEIYGAEIADDDEPTLGGEEEAAAKVIAESTTAEQQTPAAAAQDETTASITTEKTQQQTELDIPEVIPKEATDATEANDKKVEEEPTKEQ